MKKVLLFLNGNPPNFNHDFNNYDLIICTDGAFNYVKNINLKVDYVIGDFDSIDQKQENIEYIFTPDQNKTDFEKSLDFIYSKKLKNIHILGASGLENDHFLGNISVALQFKNKLNLLFFDDYSTFFFANKNTKINIETGKIVSLIPLGTVENISTKGLKYPLNNENLTFGQRIGSRNQAINNQVFINFSKGNLLIFIQK